MARVSISSPTRVRFPPPPRTNERCPGLFSRRSGHLVRRSYLDNPRLDTSRAYAAGWRPPRRCNHCARFFDLGRHRPKTGRAALGQRQRAVCVRGSPEALPTGSSHRSGARPKEYGRAGAAEEPTSGVGVPGEGRGRDGGIRRSRSTSGTGLGLSRGDRVRGSAALGAAAGSRR